jgi:hypothetical protein
MKRTSLLVIVIMFLAAAPLAADPLPCDCTGGVDVTGAYWYLLDFTLRPLESGDWVYAAWTGPDGEIDPPSASGGVTSDDVFLHDGTIEYGGFFFSVTSWAQADGNHPWPGESIYCRMFDGPQGVIGSSNYYADSQLYQVQNLLGEVFYCVFPGDPDSGHTDTPVPGGTPVEGAGGSQTPADFTLLQNSPNPFNASTEIIYRLADDGPVSLRIFNTLGQQVRRLVAGRQAAGEYSIVWDGRDEAGQELSSGVYVCAVEAGAHRASRKMVLLR